MIVDGFVVGFPAGVLLVPGTLKTGRLFGTLSRDGTPPVPVHARVSIAPTEESAYRVLGAGSAPPVYGAATNPSTGAWEVRGLNPNRKYHVIAYDPTGQYDPVIKMNLTPTVD